LLAIRIGNQIGSAQTTQEPGGLETPIQTHWGLRAGPPVNPNGPREPVAQVRLTYRDVQRFASLAHRFVRLASRSSTHRWIQSRSSGCPSSTPERPSTMRPS
jgi:hypothetical protein